MGYSRRGPAATGQCSAMVYVGNWPGNCTRPAVEDGLCRPHLTGRRRRDANNARRQAEFDAERTQAAFVAEWRAEHPDYVWPSGWTCPLCLRVIQESDESWRERVVRDHQREHADDWTRYASLAAAATGDGREGK